MEKIHIIKSFLPLVILSYFIAGISGQRVGCDGVLGSGLVLDKCGVCGGSNTDCQITREIFDKDDLNVGYHVIASVPEGAMYINMTEMSRSRNYLALRSSSGKPYINGAWHIDYPGNFTVAGTVFEYKRPSRTDDGEQIIAMGPTTEAVDIMMIYQQANPGIYYEYTIPLHKPSDVRGVGGDFVNEDGEESDYSSYSYYEVSEVDIAGPTNRQTGTFPANHPDNSNPGVPPGGSTGSRNPAPPVGTYPSKYPTISQTAGQGSPQGRPGSNVPIYGAVDTSGSHGGPGTYSKTGGNLPIYPPIQSKPVYLPYSLPAADTPYIPRQHGYHPTDSDNTRYPPRVMEPQTPNGPTQQHNPGMNDALRQPPVGTYDLPEEVASSSIVTEGETNSLMYYWMETQMTVCSQSCAGGIQQSMSKCVDHISLSPVEDNMCVIDWKPALKTMACNTQPCPPTWTAGEWTECSSTCGSSQRIRQVLCKEQRTQSVITTVPLVNCNQTARPTSVEECDVPTCPSWVAGNWSECSVDCGSGEKQRRVSCRQEGIEVSDRHCSDQTKPTEVGDCDMGSCMPDWLYSSFSESCSAECGAGYKSRNVICSTAGRAGAVSQEKCSGMTKPKATKICNRQSCGAKWMTTEWSQCTSDCGPGTQQRMVMCVSTRNGNSVARDSDCRDEKPAESKDCNLRQCGSTWYTSEFTQCSRSCDGGVMTRTVKCLNEAFEPSTECSEDDQPSLRHQCNPQECVDNAPPTTCRDKFSYCNKVARSRLCSYSYYSRLCCYSCYNQVNNR